MVKKSVYLMGLLYVLAGINHFVHPAMYIKIIPAWLGRPEALVGISGFCEILLGILLIPGQTRSIAAWGIIALLVAVFPANIQMMLNYIHEHNPHFWITIVRLPIQLLLIWWAYVFTKTSAAIKHN